MVRADALASAVLLVLSSLALGACLIGEIGATSGGDEGGGASSPSGGDPGSSGPGSSSASSASGAGGQSGSATVGAGGGGGACGDAACTPGESCMSCPMDCGACPATCGNQACEADETCMNCPMDCGACPPVCGDQMCQGSETCMNCPMDCGPCEVCAGAGPMTTPLDVEEQSFLSLLNQYRAQNGLGAVTACTSLSRAAQGHSEDMRDKNYFSHTGLNGSTPWERACDACYDLGCGPQTQMAENIASGNATGQATFDQWKNSSGHNANMLTGAFKVIGVGRATGGGDFGIYWTTVFGADPEASCN